MAEIYQKTIEKYEYLKKNGLIDGINKMKSTFKDVYLDNLFYVDFYSIEIFGKTKLGQLLLYAKQSQDKALMKELFSEIKPKVDSLLKEYDINGIGFIPPTVRRKVQFMKELEKALHPDIRKISIVKARTDVAVPQKTLAKLEDRVENAKKTIIVNESGRYRNILLIDDALGSGATLNETAAQIRKRKICDGKIIGLAITGSLKGFDIISEV
jgi:predicted amidophosphoribosyltransferase